MVEALKNTRNDLIALWLLMIGSALLIALTPSQIHLIHGYDKVAHFVAFAALMIMPAMSIKCLKTLIIFSMFLIFIGIFVECVQFFIPERDASLQDIVANILGVSFGLIPMAFRLN